MSVRKIHFQKKHLPIDPINDQPNPCIVVNIDLAGKITSANLQAELFFGFKTKEIVGLSLIDVIFAPGQNETNQKLVQALQFPKTIHYLEFQCQRSNYELAWLGWTLHPINNWLGRTTGICLAGREITTYINTESDSKRKDQPFKTIFQSFQAGLLLVDPQTDVIIDANPAMLELIGMPKSEVLGRTCHDIGCRITKEHSPLNGSKKLSELFECHFHNRHGQKLTLTGQSTPAIINQKESVLKSFINVTDSRHLQAELAEAKVAANAALKAKGQFLANINYEIRTPLNGIVTMAEILMNLDIDSGFRDYISIIQQSAKSLTHIVNDVLDYASIETGQLKMKTSDIDIGLLVEDVADAFALSAHTKGLEFICYIDPQIPGCVRTDQQRLRQILENMLHNAVKFTNTGEVSILVEALDQGNEWASIQFTIKDTGKGIAADQVDHLFESFTKGNEINIRNPEGIGLGLTIAKHLVELMGSRIQVTSEPEQGTTFWFALRMRIVDNAQEALKAYDISRRILLVTHKATTQRVLENYLYAWGYQHFTFCPVSEAHDALLRACEDNQAFDQMLIEHHNDSDKLASQIKSDLKLGKVNIALLGIPASLKKHEQIPPRNFDAFISKPIRRSDLKIWINGNTNRITSAPCKPAQPQTPREPVTPASNDPLYILLVEDNLVNQKVASKILTKSGFKVDIAENGLKGLERLRQTNYDLVLMDIQMPEMDGLETTRRIRDPQTTVLNPQIPIIAVTAHAMSTDRQQCIDAGMNDYLTKPINPKELLATINNWLPSAKQFTETHAFTSGSNSKENDTPLNLSKAMERAMGDADFLCMLLDEFLAQIPNYIETIQSALDNEDTNQLKEQAHTLKGAALSLSASPLAQAALSLETIGRENKLDQGASLLDDLKKKYASLQVFLRQKGYDSNGLA